MCVTHAGDESVRQNLDLETQIQIVLQIFEKCRSEFTKAHRFKQKYHFFWGGAQSTPQTHPHSSLPTKPSVFATASSEFQPD